MHAPLVYSVAQAALLLGVSRSRLYELLASGEIPSIKIGRLRKIRAEALDDYLDLLEEVS